MCHFCCYHTGFLDKNNNGLRDCIGIVFGLLGFGGSYNFDTGFFLFHNDVQLFVLRNFQTFFFLGFCFVYVLVHWLCARMDILSDAK